MLGCASQPPRHLVAVTTLSRPPNLRELTPVQLQILGLLVKAGPTPESAPPGATAARRPSEGGYHSASRGSDHDASADQRPLTRIGRARQFNLMKGAVQG